MKKSSPERKHTSILTYLFLALTLLFTRPSTTYALCDPGKSTANNNIPCRVGTTTYYCGSATECTGLKNNLNKTSNSASGGGGPSVDPTGSCGQGSIDTALGCIPYETKGFTAALLTFLAGTAGAVSLVIMLIATFQIMTGGDNAEQVKKGKELFTGAITGLLFIIFSVTLLRVIAGDIIKLPGFN
jgi:hypothetical protein